MRSVLRTGIFVTVLAALAVPLTTWGTAAAQSAAAVDPALKQRVERRFRVLPVSDGVVLTPLRPVRGVQSIEVRRGVIAVNGTPTTGAQLRERLGPDADLVLQVSYLPEDVLRRWAGEEAEQEPAAPPAAEPSAPAQPPEPTPEEERPVRRRSAPPSPDDSAWRKSSAKVHIGSDIIVAEDEYVTDPVVAVGGNVTVLGRVEDDVVAVLGSVRLGPKAYVRGDVTAVGGAVEQERGATIGGSVNEVRIGGSQFRFEPWHVFAGWFGWDMFGGWFRLLGTLLRISIVLLLVFLIAIVAPGPMQRIGERAGRDPWLSGFTGLLAQLLFVPVLVLTVVVLAVSIIGIPLLVLVPFAIIAFLIAFLIGFAGVAYYVGRWAVGDARPLFVTLAVGVILVSAVTLVARSLSLVTPLWPIAWMVAVLGFLVEYLAWTVGLGAALLTRFGTRGSAPSYTAPVVPPPLPVVSGPTEA